MKTNKKIIGFIILFVILIGGVFTYSYIQERNINEKFSYDVIRTLREVYLSRGLDMNENNEFDTAYMMKEHILNAKQTMGIWESDKNNFRKEISRSMLNGIDDLMLASDAYINILRTPSAENLALFKAKLEEGRKDLFGGSVALVLKDNGVQLFESQKKDIVDWIERILKDELEKYSDSTKDRPREIWAVIIIKNNLSSPTHPYSRDTMRIPQKP